MRSTLSALAFALLCACQPNFAQVGDPSDDTGVDTGDHGGAGPGPSLYINEFMASNTDLLFNEEAENFTPDWIELYNTTDEPISLLGMQITDDIDGDEHHILADLIIGPMGYLVLFADGDPEAGDKHLDFKLDVDGETIGLYDVDGHPLDRVEYTDMMSDMVGARIPDGGPLEISMEPTPGSANPTESSK